MFPFASGHGRVAGVTSMGGPQVEVAGAKLEASCRECGKGRDLLTGSASPSLGKRVIRPFSKALIRCLRMLAFFCLNWISYTAPGSVPSASSTAYAIANTPQSVELVCLYFTLLCRACLIFLWDSLRSGVYMAAICLDISGDRLRFRLSYVRTVPPIEVEVMKWCWLLAWCINIVGFLR